jgi:transposase
MTTALVDGLRACGHFIGLIDESYTSQMCSRAGYTAGMCDAK